MLDVCAQASCAARLHRGGLKAFGKAAAAAANKAGQTGNINACLQETGRGSDACVTALAEWLLSE